MHRPTPDSLRARGPCPYRRSALIGLPRTTGSISSTAPSPHTFCHIRRQALSRSRQLSPRSSARGPWYRFLIQTPRQVCPKSPKTIERDPQPIQKSPNKTAENMCILPRMRTDTELAASTRLDLENENFDDLGWLCLLPQVSSSYSVRSMAVTFPLLVVTYSLPYRTK